MVIKVVKKDGCPTKFNSVDSISATQPSQAASKVLTALCKVKRIEGICIFYVTVREVGADKMFTYICERKMNNLYGDKVDKKQSAKKSARNSKKGMFPTHNPFPFKNRVRKAEMPEKPENCTRKSPGMMRKRSYVRNGRSK